MINKAKIKSAAEKILAVYNIPSISMTFYENGAYESITVGYKDKSQNAAATDDTVYAIGSATKSFTAASLALLCDRGLLDLDEPVITYLPELELYDTYTQEHMTVRDMLCHRSGLPRHELAWYPRLAEYSTEQMMGILQYLKPNQPFRYKMQYQNIMYALAGVLISRVSGVSWAEFVEENLVKPLNLGKISYDATQLTAMEARATGYCTTEEVPYCQLNSVASAGSLAMTSRQLATWATFLLHKGWGNGTQIISEANCAQMSTPQMLISNPILAPLQGYLDMTSYGLGLFAEKYRGAKVLQHGGHIDGFIGDMCFVPEKDFACTVLTNSEHPYGARVLRYLILDELLGAEETDWIQIFGDYRKESLAKLAANMDQLETTNADPASLRGLCGTYTDPGYGEITLSLERDGLALQLGTLTLHGVPAKKGGFYFTEEVVLPGAALEAEAELDTAGNPVAFLIGLEPEDTEKIRFIRKED